MNEEEIKDLEKYLKSLPKISNNMSIPITTSFGINLDDLMNAVKEVKKVPTYDELLRENKQLKGQLQQKEDIINKAKEYCNFCIKEWITDDGFVEEVLKDVLEILDNKGE